MSEKIITITREFGSGGRTIGKKVAQKLGIPCYDEELLEKMVKESGFVKEYIEEQSEDSVGWLNSILSYNGLTMTNQDKLWVIQQNLILDLAQQGSCVIVGRCADYILRDENILSVFIHADMEHRANRIVTEYGEREQSPQQRLNDKDRRRAAYYRFYTDMKWSKAQNYHLSLDSGKFGIDKCVDIIISAFQD